MIIETWPIDRIKPYPNNPRSISPEAIEKIGESLKAFSFRQPIVVDKDGIIICGHGRWLGARHIGLTEVPVHVAHDLTPEQSRAYRIADNRVAQESDWDSDLLKVELMDLGGMFTGFDGDELADLGGSDAEIAVDDQAADPVTCPKCGHCWEGKA